MEFPEFPSPSQLAQLIQRQPLPTDTVGSSRGLAVETWELEGPLPDRHDDTPQQFARDVPPVA